MSPGFLNTDSLRSHLARLSVPSLFPDSPDYAKYAQSYNRVFSYQPAVICIPHTEEHVSSAVVTARAHGLKVQARGGGHSYAAYSAGGKDGSLIVDMRRFDGVELIPPPLSPPPPAPPAAAAEAAATEEADTTVATVGAGVRLGRLAGELCRHNNTGRGRAVPHGTIQNVGVAGHFSHGGYGYQSRAWGLALDSIRALDVVLADGRRVHVAMPGSDGQGEQEEQEEEDHGDLFYALRGAADSFGIITRFYLATQPAPKRVVLFSYDIAGVVDNVDVATAAFLHLQQVVQDGATVDRNLSFGIYIHEGAWTIWGVYLGEQAHFETHIGPNLLGGFTQHAVETKSLVQSLPWLDCLAWFSASHSNDATHEAFDTFYASSVVVPESAPLSAPVAREYFGAMRDASRDILAATGTATGPSPSPSPSQAWYAVINLHGGADSQINRVAPEASAFTHRDSLWVAQHYGHSVNHRPPLLESTKAVVRRLTDVLRNGVAASAASAASAAGLGAEAVIGLQREVGAEPNYHDPDMARDVAHRLHYGEAATRRLAAIKARWDPEEVFWNPQSIRPAAALLQ